MKSTLMVSHWDSGVGSRDNSPTGGCHCAWCRGRGHMSSHTDQCNRTSVATSNSRPLTPVSSTCKRVLLLRCHGVGIQSVSGGPFHLGHESCHKSGAGHWTLTILPPALTLSDLSTTLPLPSPLTLPSLHCRTPFRCLTALLPLLQWPLLLQGHRLRRGLGGAWSCPHYLHFHFHGPHSGTGHQTCPWSGLGNGGV